MFQPHDYMDWQNKFSYIDFFANMTEGTITDINCDNNLLSQIKNNCDS